MSLKIEDASSAYVPSQIETYEQWFQRQVEIGLNEADAPGATWVSQDEVFRALEERRKEWRSRAERHRDVA